MGEAERQKQQLINRIAWFFKQRENMKLPEDDEPVEGEDGFNPESDQYDEDYQDRGGEATCKFVAEDMLTNQFRDSVFTAKCRGKLGAFLSGVGLNTEENVVKVEALLQQYYPTFYHQTDALYELLEQELLQTCLGGSTRIGDMTAEGEFILDPDSEDRKLATIETVMEMRQFRLRLKNKIDKLDGV